MGELDTKPFHEAMKKIYNEDEADERASELCSLWAEYLKDPDWHPFKVIKVEGKDTAEGKDKVILEFVFSFLVHLDDSILMYDSICCVEENHQIC